MFVLTPGSRGSVHGYSSLLPWLCGGMVLWQDVLHTASGRQNGRKDQSQDIPSMPSVTSLLHQIPPTQLSYVPSTLHLSLEETFLSLSKAAALPLQPFVPRQLIEGISPGITTLLVLHVHILVVESRDMLAFNHVQKTHRVFKPAVCRVARVFSSFAGCH